MLLAINRQGKLIDAGQLDPRQSSDYYCPACRGRVFLKKGTKRMAHFCHFQESACQGFSEGETRDHLAGKRFLANYFKAFFDQVDLEAPIQEINQRPDLLLSQKGGRVKLAIEFQCSPISVQQILDRTAGYTRIGYPVLWILGPPLHLRTKLLTLHRAMMNSHLFTSPSLLSLDLKQKSLHVHYNFLTGESLTWQNQVLKDFPKQKQLADPLAQASRKAPSQLYLSQQRRQVKRLHYHKAKSARPFFQLLYSHHDHLLALPDWIFYPCPYDWLIVTPAYEWKYRVFKWVESLPQAKSIRLKDLADLLRTLVQDGHLQIYETDGLAEKLVFQNLTFYLGILTDQKILAQNKVGSWQKVWPGRDK